MKNLFRFAIRGCRSVQRRCRNILYHALMAKMGRDCQISSRVVVYGYENIELGDQVILNDQVVLQATREARIIIGDRTAISYGAKILTGQFSIDKDGRLQQTHVQSDVIIEEDVWIAAGAIILRGVTVGRGSIVGAGAIVRVSVPRDTLVLGPMGKGGTGFRRLSDGPSEADPSTQSPK